MPVTLKDPEKIEELSGEVNGMYMEKMGQSVEKDELCQQKRAAKAADVEQEQAQSEANLAAYHYKIWLTLHNKLRIAVIYEGEITFSDEECTLLQEAI